MRMRKKPNLPRRIEKCGAVHISDPETYRGKWLESFPGYKALHIEIGCGRGRFTAETALQNPKILLVGVERVPEALIIGMERAARENITNLRFFIGDATRLRSFRTRRGGADLYKFCDRRITATKKAPDARGLLNIYKELLCPGGEIHFKTDNDALFKFFWGI